MAHYQKELKRIRKKYTKIVKVINALLASTDYKDEKQEHVAHRLYKNSYYMYPLFKEMRQNPHKFKSKQDEIRGLLKLMIEESRSIIDSDEASGFNDLALQPLRYQCSKTLSELNN